MAKGPILVGVDGSESSLAALRWAKTQAEATGESLSVIATWALPTSYGMGEFWPEGFDFEADTKVVLEDALRTVFGEAGASIPHEVIEGHAAQVLTDASSDASLVVIGSRGHGEFAGMLLGSVSEFLATHAYCPVVIIRGDG